MHEFTRLTLKQKITKLEKQLHQTVIHNRISITVALVLGFILGKLS
jgi:uncharacterized membrane protein affecting hemolysin expression